MSESIFFTSFGLLLALMTKTKCKKLKKVHQFSISILPTAPIHIQQQIIERKKKGKRNKRAHKNDFNDLIEKYSFPKSEMNEQQRIQYLQKQEKQKKQRCQIVGNELQALISYFLDDIETIIPYNGNTGVYKIIIPIPGATYSEIPIQIIFNKEYPNEDLPIVNIHTHNLHPLQKQKLNEIVEQQKMMFKTIPKYQYIVNLCMSVSQDLFDRVNKQQMQANDEKDRLKQIEDQKINKQNKIKQSRKRKTNQLFNQNDKQNYQNFLQEMLHQHDQDNQNNLSSGNVKPAEQIAKRHHNSRGRYSADYEQLQMIGQGGFGRVYKVRNRVDNNIYAIKKMVINYNDPQSKKMLKEVTFLSKLNHPNIVRYHQSWLEDTASVDQLIMDMSITDPSQIQEFNKIWHEYMKDQEENKVIYEYGDEDQDDSVMFGDDIVFGDYSDVAFQQTSQIQESSKHKDNQYSEDESFSKTIISKGDQMMRKHSEIHEFPFKILYIVMQFCSGMTLKNFIVQRFNEDNDIKIKLIRGMLQGISYIHARRIIHRDLKPANIFLIENTNKVKIGDFGLATIGNEHNPFQEQIVQYSEKTRGVGTSYYRALEQLKTGNYDEKIDIYSIGIILLQMFYPFGTNMQRHEILNEVTKTHRLPKDFRKIQNNSEYEEVIESCISVKPEKRPSIQKLLQTFRNKYFTLLVSCIANPKHFQFYQLMNHLFTIKNESGALMKQTLFRNYLTYQLTKIYQIHRGVQFAPISLMPISDFNTLNGLKVPSSRKQKYLLMSEKGIILEYSSSAYSNWIRYAKQTIKRNKKDNQEPSSHFNKLEYFEMNQQMRRYTFEKVVEFVGGDIKSEHSFKEKYVTAFDIAHLIGDGYTSYYLCQMLQICISMLQTMDLTQKKPPILLNHSLIFKYLSLCLNVPQGSLYNFLLSTTDDKFRTLKHSEKIQYCKKFGIQGNVSKQLVRLMQSQYETFQDFKMAFTIKHNAHQAALLLNEIQESLDPLLYLLDLFNIQQRIRWKLQIPPNNTYGIFWNVGPIKGFTSIQQYAPECYFYNYHLQTLLNLGPQENQADVSIWSNGQYLQDEIMSLVHKCWQHQVSVKLYDQSIGEKDLTCRNNIILKKKNDRVYLMIRKNVDRYTLDKKYSQDGKQQNKESSFMLKQNFNYDVLWTFRKDTSKRNIN